MKTQIHTCSFASYLVIAGNPICLFDQFPTRLRMQMLQLGCPMIFFLLVKEEMISAEHIFKIVVGLFG